MAVQFEQTCMSLLVSSCECPLCHRILRPPLKMCTGGHTFCGMCAHPAFKCSICRSPFTDYRFCVFEKMLKIVSCVCMHAKSGCSLFLDSDHKVAHERICEWRLVDCLWCPWAGPVKMWAEHIVGEHGPQALSQDAEGTKTIPMGVDVDKALFKINGVMFCLFSVQDRDAPLFVVLQCFPTNERDMRTVFSISLVNKGLHFSQSIHPISDSVPRKDVFLNLDSCIIIPHYIKRGKGNFSFAITQGVK